MCFGLWFEFCFTRLCRTKAFVLQTPTFSGHSCPSGLPASISPRRPITKGGLVLLQRGNIGRIADPNVPARTRGKIHALRDAGDHLLFGRPLLAVLLLMLRLRLYMLQSLCWIAVTMPITLPIPEYFLRCWFAQRANLVVTGHERLS